MIYKVDLSWGGNYWTVYRRPVWWPFWKEPREAQYKTTQEEAIKEAHRVASIKPIYLGRLP